jgi:paraquat-inducible protein B
VSDSPRPPDTQAITTPTIKRKSGGMSWIWIVPIVAALAGLSLVARTWLEAGPQITISFQSADGLEVNKTQVRYKEVNIGTVSGIRLSEDRSKVVVTANLDKRASSLAREGTSFWVVRPRLGLNGVSGLGTLLSGAYIGLDAREGKPESMGASKTEFTGLETPPEVTYDRPGKRFTLSAHDLGSLDIGSPVYYRRIPVGRVIGYQLDDSGRTVNVQVFIDAPNDKYVTADSRFWNASGVDFTVNADGLKVRTQSLLSVAVGGVAFEAVDESAAPAPANKKFELFSTETAAKAKPDGEVFPIRMRFDQSVRGLQVGAPVDFNGITLGQISAITIDFDPVGKRFFAIVDANLYPQRLGSVYERVNRLAKDEIGAGQPGDRLLKGMVEHGLRAQLRTGNLLSGQLYVVLDVFPQAKPVQFSSTTPMTIPTVPGSLDQLQQQVTNIVDKIDKIPFDQIGQDLRTTLGSTAKLMSRLDKQVAPQATSTLKQAAETLREAQKSLSSLDGLVNSDSSLPTNAARTLQELGRAARSLRALADFLQSNPEALLRGRGNDPIPGNGPVRN